MPLPARAIPDLELSWSEVDLLVAFPDDAREAFLELTRHGQTAETCAKLVKVPWNIISRFIAKGRDYTERREFVEFATLYDEADATGEQRLVDILFKAAETDWRAADRILEKRFKGWEPVTSSVKLQQTTTEVTVNANFEGAEALSGAVDTLNTLIAAGVLKS